MSRSCAEFGDVELLGWSRVLVIVARSSLCGGGQLAGRAQLW